MQDSVKISPVQRRADAVIVVSKGKGLLPIEVVARIETLVCAHCLTQKCKACPVEGMIDQLKVKEAWD